ncbi:hypothetical protein cypCar_00039719 [Cyprinus carpio]|nr:hypothetical protein cypCar_00039719 [Cyprinus carpio]
MTSLRQQELAPVLLGYLKQRHASGSPCGSDTSSLSAWFEESFGKFSIYVDYNDLREINAGFDSFESLDLLSASQVAQLTLHSGALNNAHLIEMVFDRLEGGNSFQDIEEFLEALSRTSQDLDINPVVRDIMMNRTFTIISLHFADFLSHDWLSWFTVKLVPLLPSLTAEMLHTVTSNTDCNAYHVMYAHLVGPTQAASGAWFEESFGKFSIYVDYNDLREINAGFEHRAATLSRYRRVLGGSLPDLTDLDINPVVRDIMMNRTFTIISLHFADFLSHDWLSWFTVKLVPLLPSLTAEMLHTVTSNTDCTRIPRHRCGSGDSVFDQMTSLRQQELAPVLLGYLKQRHASGRSSEGGAFAHLVVRHKQPQCLVEESFGKFSIYVDYNDLREINAGFDSLTLHSGALNNAHLIEMVFDRLEAANSFQDIEEFWELSPGPHSLSLGPSERFSSCSAATTLWSAEQRTPDRMVFDRLEGGNSFQDIEEFLEALSRPHSVVALSSVFDQMTSLRQQELAPVLLGYLKQRHASGSPCGSDKQQPQCLAEEKLWQSSIYVDYNDLREINAGFGSFEALDILSSSQVAH